MLQNPESCVTASANHTAHVTELLVTQLCKNPEKVTQQKPNEPERLATSIYINSYEIHQKHTKTCDTKTTIPEFASLTRAHAQACADRTTKLVSSNAGEKQS